MLGLRSWRISGESRCSREEGKASMAEVIMSRAVSSLRVRSFGSEDGCIVLWRCGVGQIVEEVYEGMVDVESFGLSSLSCWWGKETALSMRWRVVRGVIDRGAGRSFWTLSEERTSCIIGVIALWVLGRGVSYGLNAETSFFA